MSAPLLLLMSIRSNMRSGCLLSGRGGAAFGSNSGRALAPVSPAKGQRNVGPVSEQLIGRRNLRASSSWIHRRAVVTFCVVGFATSTVACDRPTGAGGGTGWAAVDGEDRGQPARDFLQPLGRLRLTPRHGEIIGRVGDLVVTDSLVIVTDRIEANIKIFGGDGRYIRTLGRKGNGPAEFQAPLSVVLLPAGDRIAVLDGQRMRVSIWSLDGKELTSWPHRMVLATSLAWMPGRGLALIGVTGDNSVRTPRHVVHLLDITGRLLSEFGDGYPITHPREATFTTYTGDQVGAAIVFTHTSTNRVTELVGDSIATFEAGSDFYIPWDWDARDATTRKWMEQQIWTMKVIGVDSSHYVVGLGYPVPQHRTYHYRYVLMRLGAGEIASSELIPDQLHYARNGIAYGAEELEDGTAELVRYTVLISAPED